MCIYITYFSVYKFDHTYLELLCKSTELEARLWKVDVLIKAGVWVYSEDIIHSPIVQF